MDPFSSALALAEAIRTKRVSPVEAVEHYLARIDALDPTLNAFVWRRDDELRKEAREAERAVMHGDDLPPFHGVPIPIKDLTEVKGEPMTLGSRATTGFVGRHDTHTVAALKRAGFLLMGRTNTPEFGILPFTENEAYGPTRNPWAHDRTPGGSSGGAAVAVAAGLAPIAHASDGGGSIRIPASCTGLVGLKPSRGRIPKGPMISETLHGFTTDGVVTRTVADTAAALDQLAHWDPEAWSGAPPFHGSYLEESRRDPPKLRIAATLQGPLTVDVEPACKEAWEKAIKVLTDLGHDVFEGHPAWDPFKARIPKDFLAVWNTSGAYTPELDWSKTEPLSRGMLEKGLAQNSIDYVKAVMRLQVFSRAVVRSWREFDVLLTPTLAMEPPPIGWLWQTKETDPNELLMRCTRFCPAVGWVNVTGQPAVSLPLHWSDSGLPIGIQLVGPPFREDLLLRLAGQIERAAPWHGHYAELEVYS